MSDYITQDLLFLILKRLPVKTLLRCRCVSKSWNQLIASKSFILDHLSVQTPGIVIQNYDLWYHLVDPHTLPSLRTLKGPNSIKRVKRSHNGFTFSSVHGVNCIYNNANTLVLFNPSTRQLLNIPLPKSSILRINSNAPFKYCGFCIDPSNNYFKVVIFCLKAKKALLLSSKENVWIEVDMGGIRGGRANSQSPQVMIDGVAHWIAYNENSDEDGFVISFDFEQRRFGTIDLDPLYEATGIPYLCKWQDDLAVAQCDRVLDGEVLNFWVMQNGSWSKMFSLYVPRDEIFGVNCMLDSSGRVLAESMYGLNMVLYDPKDGVIPLETTSGITCFLLSYDFVESLVFPDSDCISRD